MFGVSLAVMKNIKKPDKETSVLVFVKSFNYLLQRKMH